MRMNKNNAVVELPNLKVTRMNVAITIYYKEE